MPRLHPTLRVQMFVTCLVHSCLHLFLVSIRIQHISPVQSLVRTCADRALSYVAHSRGCHLRAVQHKDVIKISAHTHMIVCKTQVDIEHKSFRSAMM